MKTSLFPSLPPQNAGGTGGGGGGRCTIFFRGGPRSETGGSARGGSVPPPPPYPPPLPPPTHLSFWLELVLCDPQPPPNDSQNSAKQVGMIFHASGSQLCSSGVGGLSRRLLNLGFWVLGSGFWVLGLPLKRPSTDKLKHL